MTSRRLHQRRCYAMVILLTVLVVVQWCSTFSLPLRQLLGQDDVVSFHSATTTTRTVANAVGSNRRSDGSSAPVKLRASTTFRSARLANDEAETKPENTWTSNSFPHMDALPEQVTIRTTITDRQRITDTPCFAETPQQIQECLLAQENDHHRPAVAFICPQGNDHEPYNHVNNDSNTITTFPCDPRKAMLAIPTAMVVNNRGSVLDVQRGIVYDVAGGLSIQRDKTVRVGRTVPIPPTKATSTSKRPLLSLSQRHDNTYYHFVVDSLGKLLFDKSNLLIDWVQQGWLDFFISGEANMHQKFLNLLLCHQGIDANTMAWGNVTTSASSPPPCWSPSQRHYKMDIVGQAVFPFILMPPDRVDTHKSVVQQGLHTALRAACPSISTSDKSKKFVVLKRGKNRRVLNLVDMVQVLEELYSDVEFVWADDSMLSELSLCDTYALFGNAEGIIGGHGAGLTNMLFFHPLQNIDGTVVVQFLHRDQPGAICYQRLTNHLGIRHYEMTSVTHLAKPERGRIGQYEDTVIDICQAERILRQVFEPISSQRSNSPLLSKLCSSNNSETMQR